MNATRLISDLDLFAAVRERILARRNPKKLVRERAELAVMTDREIDDFERLLIIQKEERE